MTIFRSRSAMTTLSKIVLKIHWRRTVSSSDNFSCKTLIASWAFIAREYHISMVRGIPDDCPEKELFSVYLY